MGSHGLSDLARSVILARVQATVDSMVGKPMVFQLFETGREALTDVTGSNRGTSICPTPTAIEVASVASHDPAPASDHLPASHVATCGRFRDSEAQCSEGYP